jgi:hypothetical protein
MAAQKIPLFGSLTNRNVNPNSFNSYDQKFINCYPVVDTNSLSGQGTVHLNKRMGFSSADLAAAGYLAMPGGCIWTGNNSIAVAPYLSGTNLRVYDTAGNLIADTIAGITSAPQIRITETIISGVAYLTIVAAKASDSKVHAWYVAAGGGAWTEITDVDFPSNQTPALTPVGALIHMDGYAFIQDKNGNIWNSDLNSLSSWSATSYINAQSLPSAVRNARPMICV